jgi:chorismate mutase
VFDEALPSHDLEVLECDRALHRVTAERQPVGKRVRSFKERLGDLLGRDQRPIEAYADDRPFATVTRSGRMS